MEIKIGNLESRIVTDNPELLRTLVDKYSIKYEGYQYSGAYKAGKWDGSKKFISDKGVFKSGLIQEILDDLSKIECTPTLTYENHSNIESPEIHTDGLGEFNLYDYQIELVQKALDNKRGVIKSPTGSGKTLILAAIINSIRYSNPEAKVVVLFASKQILAQTYEFLTKDCGMENIGICFGDGFILADVMLCSIKSLEKIIDTHLEQSIALLVDEVHEFSNGKMSVATLNSFPNAEIRLGLTATPPSEKMKKYNLMSALGPVIDAVTTQDLTASGMLTEAKIQLIELPDVSGTESYSYPEVYEDYIINYEYRNNIIENIIETIHSKNTQARILILTKNLAHGELLQRKLSKYACYYLYGDKSISDRYLIIDKFRKHRKNSILIGTSILQTGVNIKEITHLIVARGLKSEIATIQAIGRALRSHDSKDVVYIYDFLDKGKYLSKHSKQRLTHYKKEGHRITVISHENC